MNTRIPFLKLDGKDESVPRDRDVGYTKWDPSPSTLDNTYSDSCVKCYAPEYGRATACCGKSKFAISSG